MTKITDDSRINDMTYGEFFNVQLHNGDNPAIDLTVDFEGMPIKNLAKLAWDTMKVKFRPHVKGMSTETFKATFDKKTITWREMITKSGVGTKIELAEKSATEIEGEIARLEALLKGKKDINTIDDDKNDIENIDITNDDDDGEDNDINSDDYIPTSRPASASDL